MLLSMLFSRSKADVAVNLEDVEKFSRAVECFFNETKSTKEDIDYTLSKMIEMTRDTAEELGMIVASNKNLYTLIKNLESQLGNEVSSLKDALSRTPKEIKYEVKKENGETETRTESNPEYNQLQNRIKSVEIRLSQVKDLAWNVYNEISASERKYNDAISYLRDLEAYYQEIFDIMLNMNKKTEKAYDSLNEIISIIKDYINYNITYYK